MEKLKILSENELENVAGGAFTIAWAAIPLAAVGATVGIGVLGYKVYSKISNISSKLDKLAADKQDK